MIDALNPRKEGTRRAVAPSDKKKSPAEREELNFCSQLNGFARFRDGYLTIWNTLFVLLRGCFGDHLHILSADSLCMMMWRRCHACPDLAVPNSMRGIQVMIIEGEVSGR